MTPKWCASAPTCRAAMNHGSSPEKRQAPALLLAESWDGVSDPTGWHLSEKLDGVRAFWTGTEFQSRLGNVFHAPDWFVAGLPREPLDGELWIGRKCFQRTVGIVRRQDKTDLWKQVRYLIFDAPDAGVGIRGPNENHRADHCEPTDRLTPKPLITLNVSMPITCAVNLPALRLWAARASCCASRVRFTKPVGRPRCSRSRTSRTPRRASSAMSQAKAATKAGSAHCCAKCPMELDSQWAPACPTLSDPARRRWVV